MPVTNSEESMLRMKPGWRTGLWTSTWQSDTQDSSWIEYGRDNYIDTDKRFWHLLTPKRESKLYVIDSCFDLERLVKTYLWIPEHLKQLNKAYCLVVGDFEYAALPMLDPSFVALDFERICQDYDGIWLTEQGYMATHLPLHGYDLYSWSCECILWFRWCFERVETIKPVAAITEQIASNGTI
jgi:hypothetical protein